MNETTLDNILKEMKLLWKLEDAIKKQQYYTPQVEKLLQKLEDLRK
jgi:hypothetical protein